MYEESFLKNDSAVVCVVDEETNVDVRNKAE